MSSPTGPPVPFSELPLDESNPDAWYNAWGLYGQDDQKGFLNRVTDEMVARAAREEIQTGKRISLDLPLDWQGPSPMISRKAFQQDIIFKAPRCIHDDVWTFNSQVTSQWDGLRHYAYQKARRFYNNVSADQISNPSSSSTTTTTNINPTTDPKFLGLQNYAEHGILGRGILVDFARWRDLQLSNPSHSSLPATDLTELRTFHPFQPSPIRHRWLLSALSSQRSTTPRYGDILLIRTGFLRAYSHLTPAELSDVKSRSPFPACGVDQCPDTLAWIWNTFSAVAGDQPSFEAWPAPVPTSEVAAAAAAAAAPQDSSSSSSGVAAVPPPWTYHEVLLAGWGCPIGELFDLEELAGECERRGRWSFFLSSCVNKVPGGVAGPPNCLAVF